MPVSLADDVESSWQCYEIFTGPHNRMHEARCLLAWRMPETCTFADEDLVSRVILEVDVMLHRYW